MPLLRLLEAELGYRRARTARPSMSATRVIEASFGSEAIGPSAREAMTTCSPARTSSSPTPHIKHPDAAPQNEKKHRQGHIPQRHRIQDDAKAHDGYEKTRPIR